MMLSSVAGRSPLALARTPSVLASCISRNFSDEPKKKVKKVKRKETSGAATSGRSRDLNVVLAALDAPKSTPPPADAEEMARREKVLKNYTIGMFKQHNEVNHDLSCRMKIKKHALSMLPKNSELKEKALEIDWSGPPRWRRLPTWTPPIPGFDPKEFMSHEE
jgi:hypothetical protein